MATKTNIELSSEVKATKADLKTWLVNMITYHAYTLSEAASVCGLTVSEIENKMEELKIKLIPKPVFQTSTRLKVLPYPGGRHPRIGFQEGSIDPQRGTKVSIFPPWENGGYAVLDFPEALFCNLGLIFLAHTDVPTIWDKTSIIIDNVDWKRSAKCELYFVRALPNQILFGSTVIPRANHVDFKFWLINGTNLILTDLITQVCLLLKGMPDFNIQSNEHKLFQLPVVAAPSMDGNR